MEEIWKEVEGFEGYYEVSNLGRFRSMDRIVEFKDGRKHFYKSKMLQGSISSYGYIEVKLCRNNKAISIGLHRLVAKTFIPRDDYDELEVNHINYDRSDNRVENLEWITHKDNVHHSSDKGRYKGNSSGCKNGRANYTEEEIIYMRKLYDEGKTVMDIIKILFPSLNYNERKNKWTRIKAIVTRKTYTDIK